MASPDRSGLPTAALVAEFARRCWGSSCNDGMEFRCNGIDINVEDPDVPMVRVPVPHNMTGRGWLRVADLDDWPGIRNALVGAVLAWLRANAKYTRLNVGEEASVSVWLTKIEYGADILQIDKDELRALLMAALAVADHKEGNRG